MSPDPLFRASNGIALLGWLALVLAGRRKFTASMICKFVIPGLLSVLYLGILLTHWAGHRGGFGSVAEVQQLFTDPWLVTAGWVHYLAFDLFLGAWQVRDAERAHIRHLWTIPSLLLTFLFGPIGFLSYLLLKAFASRTTMRA